MFTTDSFAVTTGAEVFTTDANAVTTDASKLVNDRQRFDMIWNEFSIHSQGEKWLSPLRSTLSPLRQTLSPTLGLLSPTPSTLSPFLFNSIAFKMIYPIIYAPFPCQKGLSPL